MDQYRTRLEEKQSTIRELEKEVKQVELDNIKL